MREDMNKVLTERPRAGHSNKYRQVRRAENRGDLEDLPHFSGMRSPYNRGYGEYRKEFTDLLGPLYRFMDGCVGRKYDDVWSEICKAVPSGNTVDEHLKGHARDMIEHNTYLKDGEVYVRGRYNRYGSDHKPDGLYVDPRDGIIYKAPDPRANRKKKKLLHTNSIGTFEREEDGIYYLRYYYGRDNNKPEFALAFFGHEEEAIKIEGIWYWILFATVPPPVTQTYMDGDIKKTRLVDSWKTDFVYRVNKKSGERYRYSKVQMNGRDLKKHGLINSPGDLTVSFPRH